MAMKWYHKKRLLKVAELLENLPRERPKNKFDFSSWVGDDWGGAQDLSCGTTACGLGFACTIKSLRDAGLRLGDYLGTGWVHLKDRNPGPFSPQEASEAVFVLSSVQHDQIFAPGILSDDATAKDLAKLIRYFVANGTCDGFKPRPSVVGYECGDDGVYRSSEIEDE